MSSHGPTTAKTPVLNFFHEGPVVGFLKDILSEVVILIVVQTALLPQDWNLELGQPPLVSKTGEGIAKTRSANTSDPPYGFFCGGIFPVLECRRSPQAADQWIPK